MSGGLQDGRAALGYVANWLRERYGGARVRGIGHRIVHGGTRYSGPTIVTPQVLDDLRALIPLAPLHQPYNLAAIEAVSERLPDVPQVACFDTSFHRNQPAVAEIVPLPREIREGGVQRYGFHGLSYKYIASVLPSIAPEIAAGRVIVAHLGSGASMCALKNGKSVDSTLGFTALDGLCMGTRPGAVDPGVVLYLFQSLGLSAKEVETILYKKSGSSASRESATTCARCLGATRQTHVSQWTTSCIARQRRSVRLPPCSVVSTRSCLPPASARTHQRSANGSAEASAWLGIDVDDEANTRSGPRISSSASKVSAWTIPTNEELMIARHTGLLLGLIEQRV